MSLTQPSWLQHPNSQEKSSRVFTEPPHTQQRPPFGIPTSSLPAGCSGVRWVRHWLCPEAGGHGMGQGGCTPLFSQWG